LRATPEAGFAGAVVDNGALLTDVVVATGSPVFSEEVAAGAAAFGETTFTAAVVSETDCDLFGSGFSSFAAGRAARAACDCIVTDWCDPSVASLLPDRFVQHEAEMTGSRISAIPTTARCHRPGLLR
jgi:hypothetical protein